MLDGCGPDSHRAFFGVCIPGGQKTKTGYATGAEVLSTIDNPICAEVLNWRELSKLKNTYTDALERLIGPDGRIHTTYAQAVAATGKPLVVVLMNGSALAVPWVKEHAAALVEAWYPGEEGGTAIAETLAGDNNPSGRLPVGFPGAVQPDLEALQKAWYQLLVLRPKSPPLRLHAVRPTKQNGVYTLGFHPTDPDDPQTYIEVRGKLVKCQHCQTMFRVPESKRVRPATPAENAATK